MMEKTKVRILGISGSGRKANTYYAVKQALETAEEFDFVEKTEFINLGKLNLTPCTGCMRCFAWAAPADEPWFCRDSNDDSAMLNHKMCEYDGLILGFPVYAKGVNALTRVFWEKLSAFTGLQWGVGAAKVSVKVTGHICVGGAVSPSLEWALYTQILEGYGYPAAMPLPMLDDTNPLRGGIGAQVTTGMGVNVYSKDAYMAKQSRVQPAPISERNEKAIRSVGRAVAMGALMSLAGDRLIEELDIEIPYGPMWKKYNVKPRPGSMMEKRAKEGVLRLVDPSMPVYEEYTKEEIERIG